MKIVATKTVKSNMYGLVFEADYELRDQGTFWSIKQTSPVVKVPTVGKEAYVMKKWKAL